MNRQTPPPLPAELKNQLRKLSPGEQQNLERIWELLDVGPELSGQVPSTDDAWLALQTRIPTPSRSAGDREARPPRRFYRLRGIATVTFTVMLLAAVWLWSRPIEKVVPPGAQMSVVLPDGSIVDINSDSRISYARSLQFLPFLSPGSRQVKLEGEAFFRVTRNERPFIVETFNARIDVLGTQFNILSRSSTGNGETKITLSSGQVRVTRLADPADTVTLVKAGSVASVRGRINTSSPINTSEVSLERTLAWRSKGFAVVDEPLEDVLRELERRFAVEIEIGEKLAPRDSLNMFYLRGAELEDILRDICLVQGCRFSEMSTGYVLNYDSLSVE